MSEPHDVVKLLLARMESHPEEFNDDNGRWSQWLDELIPFVTEEERVMLRKPMMQTIHEEVLDELCNGEERRRKEEEETEYERHLKQSLQRMKQQQARQSALGQYQNAMGNALGHAHATGIVGRSPTSLIMNEYANIGIGNGGTGATPLERVKKFFSK